MKAGIQGAGALVAGWQARRARIDYGNKINEIKTYEASRQPIVNPYGGIENPYANLPVATQAAEIQMAQTDQALAATLDTLRETGASAGGATALAQAALQSKQGISAGIEKQETDNAKLKAQGQLQVDVIKGKGEMERFKNQEARDIQQLDRMQSQADTLRAQELASKQAMIEGLGNVGGTLIAGLTAQDQVNPNEDPDPVSKQKQGMVDLDNNSISDYIQRPTQQSLNFSQGDLNPFPNDLTKSKNQTNPTAISTALNNPGATNLSQFYGGGKLPSIKDRAIIFEGAGLGKADDYEGYGPQNDNLLEYLQTADLASLGNNK